MKSWRLVLMVVGFVIAGCSSEPLQEFLATAADTDADAEVAGESTTATTTTPPAAAEVPLRAASTGSFCAAADMPNIDGLAVSAEGGLNVRQAPRDGTIVTTLPNATIVTTSDDPLACGVLDDGSVWFLITAPTLGAPGWVHSGFLEGVGGAQTAPEPGNATAPDGDRGTAPDLESATDEAAILAAAPVITADDRPAEFGRRCSNPQLPRASELTVVNDGGVNRRAWPGDGTVIELLDPGTVVSVTVIVNQCAVLDDGSIWYEIGRGGWVHSGFLG